MQSAGPDLAWLTQPERDLLAQRGPSRRQQQFVAGRWLLRLLASRVMGTAPEHWRVEVDSNGRPFVVASVDTMMLEPDTWHASISHSGDLIAVAIDREPIGLDVECWPQPRVRDVAGLMELVGDSDEQQALLGMTNADRQRAFLRIWTLKEARLKAHGHAATADALRRCGTHPMRHDADDARAWCWEGLSAVLACWRATAWCQTPPQHWPALSVPVTAVGSSQVQFTGDAPR